MSNNIVGEIKIPWNNSWKSYVSKNNNNQLTAAICGYVFKKVCGNKKAEPQTFNSYCKKFQQDNPNIIGQRAKKKGIKAKIRPCPDQAQPKPIIKIQEKKCPITKEHYDAIQNADRKQVSDLALGLRSTRDSKLKCDAAYKLLKHKNSTVSSAIQKPFDDAKVKSALKKLNDLIASLRKQLIKYQNQTKPPAKKVPVIE